ISREYVAYADAHYRELIDRYEPWVLWNDIGYPPRTNVAKLFAYFYNHVPDGVINDRWVQFTPFLRWGASLWGINKIASWMVQHYYSKRPIVGPAPIHCDYRTPEYSVFKTIQKQKWELTRGIGNSFGYNQFETEADYVPADTLIRMFIDIVSKNGNLLLNVGPQPNGAIHEIMRARLLNLGNWLEVNGEGIFGTRSWVRAEGSTSDGISLRFTAKDPVIYVFFLERPKNKNATIQNFRPRSNARIQLLGSEEELSWSQVGKNMQVTFPDVPESPAYCLRVNQPT
ncbi:MAG TPA: alpha-L-fucosidase, partial [Candidatus Lokiarchaeia archaeon]|nr:alpha-L-fucosidase [Candidatus Lokiarchaeia archaeon]